MAVVRSAWQRLRELDPRLLDGGLAGALFLAAAAQMLASGPEQALRLPAVAGTTLPLIWRRRYPLRCYLVQFLSALLTLERPALAVLLALFVGLYSAGAYGARPLLTLAAPLGSSLVLLLLFPSANPPLPAWGLQLVAGLGVWVAGMAVRERQARLRAVEERARQLERERGLAARVAVADERARIARELHDVIAHSVSVMVVQAGAARRLLGRQPDRAGEAMREVEGSGREALTELRRLLGVLAERPDELVLAPQPGLDQLDALVGRVDAAGVPVDVRIVGTPRPLPPGLDLTAYRVVQEALTNVMKHAAGARTEVLVEYGERDLRLAVVDGGGTRAATAGAGAGRGLLGMQERVAAYGGHVEAGVLPEGGFAVRARLPMEEPA
ncbi:MAG: sensor histidine kinase [Chloroflexi bacterium]|nr:MAG: sensor histidine kinase [Chloroflexota bacterium]